jgi:tRNA(Ile)-lysidine synthase
MLAALAAIRCGRERAFILRCLHVEHGIRPAEESQGDASAVEELCAKLEVPCKIVSVVPGRIARTAARRGLGIEAAARLYRRRIWTREAQRVGASRVLTAHTRDDVLETILMRVLRGSGPAGLASMPVDGGLTLRPLLGLSRAEVLAYLEEKGLAYCTDSTNSDIRFLRNRVRLRLIPCLDSFFPHWRISILALGETQGLTAGFLAAEARRRLPWEETAGGLCLPVDAFLREPLIIREEALFEAADKLASAVFGTLGSARRAPRRASLRRFLRGLETGVPAGDLGPIRAESREGCLIIKPAGSPVCHAGGFSLLIKAPGFYTLKGRLRVKVEAREAVPETAAAGGEENFCAFLPLVLRPCGRKAGILKAGQKQPFSDILKGENFTAGLIAAEDREGIVAVIGAGKVLLSRDGVPAGENGPSLYKFSISGPV